MTEQESKELSIKILKALRKGQRELFERKAKLGETVVIADADGKPIEITAAEALKLYQNKGE